MQTEQQAAARYWAYKEDKWSRMAKFNFDLDGLLCLDFQNNFYYGRNRGRQLFSSMATFSGGTNGTSVGLDFSLKSYGATAQPRRSSSGLTYEAAATNLIRNNSNTGAIVGQLGFGGAVPTDWNMGAPSGLARNVVAFGTLLGMPYIDLRLNGTLGASASVGATDFASPAGTTNVIAAVQNDIVSTSVYCQMIAGSMANISSLLFSLNQVQADGATSNGLQSSAELTTILNDGKMRRLDLLNKTIAGATTAFISPRMRFLGGTIGNAVDITIRLMGETLSKTAFMSSPILTTNAAVTRTADSLVLKDLNVGRAVFQFDDNTTQTITGINKAVAYTIPTNLNRQVIKAARFYRN